jgi:spermidine/putrescine transport system permease protein
VSPTRIPAIAYLAAAYGFILLPVVVLVLFSFQGGLLPVPPLKGLSLRWYEAVLADRRLMEALWNSVVVATLSSLAAVVLGFLAAWGLARSGSRWTPLARFVLMAPLTVPYLIVGLGLLTTLHGAGIGKSLGAVGLGHLVINLPLCFAIATSQLGGQLESIERAAADLGAGPARTLLLVTAPMIWPALLAGFALSFTLSWDEFVIAFLLSRFEVTLPVVIWSKLRSGLNPELNAVGTLVFVISIALVVIVEVAWARRRRG